MQKAMLIPALLLGVGTIATPVFAQEAVTEVVATAREIVREITVTEIRAPDLNHYVGRILFGAGEANLGVVSTANPYTGVIGVTGRHGEFAMIDASVLTHDGWTLHAPTLTAGDIKVASDAQLANPAAILSAPHVIV